MFPELFLSGYNLGQKLREPAEPADGVSIQKLCQIAKSTGVAIITGYPERMGADIYNSALAISYDGKIIGHHRKVYLFGNREKTLFRPGSDFVAFEIAGHKCGLSICYDIEFPEVTREMKQQGIQIVFVPTANMEPYFEVPTTLARARALENGLVIVYANLNGVEGDLSFVGLSGVISPDGKDVARAGSDWTILITDLQPSFTRNETSPLSSQFQDLHAANWK